MKKLVLTTALLLSAITLFGGEKEETVTNFWYNSSTPRNLEPNHEMIVTPLIADVEIINGVATFERNYNVDLIYSVATRVQMIEEIKKRAIFDFSEQQNADIIIGSMISANTLQDANGYTKRSDDGKSFILNIKIKGYPARYANFRNATEKDRWIKNMLIIDTPEKPEQKNDNLKLNVKSSTTKIVK
ncbi:MAG: hypothetical protein PHR45_06695 [Muribaculaceae bacterium]|nr:hypothetical protein [Muribaculaceae bacterium]